ncbi:MAG: hypothetical protein IT203_10880 [Fimbriimonadaceae bacterium]|nr:hypothetical protein [Fimbriimonadaceae bacterium]
MSRLQEAEDWSEAALADDITQEKAIALWQKIFGEDYFPSTIEDEAKALAQALRPGVACVEPTGRVVTAAAASVTAVSVPMTRFHGGRFLGPRRGRTPLSSAIQQSAMKRSFPGFRSTFSGTTGIWKGKLQPQPGSPVYSVVVRYRPGHPPEVRVKSPQIRRDAPHVYPGGILCLYWPKDRNWDSSKLVAETIVPWTAEWLLYYELWLDTGEWLGPESPHRYPGKMDLRG